MIKILFICYGNICRSPMAEMIFKDLIYKRHKKYLLSCASRATSMEELGNDIYPKAKQKLMEENVTVEKHIARKITKDDYNNYDYIIVMDSQNKNDLISLFGSDPFNKIHLLMEYTGNIKDIEDPWYTDNFDLVFQEINAGCKALFEKIEKETNSVEN